jgi:hypothetical protein
MNNGIFSPQKGESSTMNKKSIGLLVSSLSTLFVSACDYPIRGNLEVTAPLVFIDKHQKSFQLEPAVHQMEVKKDQDWNGPVLKLKIYDGAGKKHKLAIPLPESSSRHPLSEGSYELPSAYSGQPFDLHAELKHGTYDSPSTSIQLPCNLYSTHLGYPNYWSSYDYGMRNVEYHLHTRTAEVNASFRQTGTLQETATYHGSMVLAEEWAVDSIGPCMMTSKNALQELD